jgi:uncharacterized protein YqgC (DUF456 family)
MAWVLYLSGALMFAIGAAAVALVLLGLPGTWLMLMFAAAIEVMDGLYLPEADQQTFSWWILGSCLLLAVLGEVLEFAAGGAGAARTGASKRGMLGAVIGGLIGSIAGAPFGLILGSFLGGMLGAAIGAIVGELTQRPALSRALRPAAGALAGRAVGTLSKVPCALLMWALLTVSAFYHPRPPP